MKYAHPPAASKDIFGLVRPAVDAHTLGVSAVEELLQECGFSVISGDALLCRAVDNPSEASNAARIEQWIISQGITRLGYSCRLDPDQAVTVFGKLIYQLEEKKLLHSKGGPVVSLYFAGLPSACERIEREFKEKVVVFIGDETPGETLRKLRIDHTLAPLLNSEELLYDDFRMDFAKEFIRSASGWQGVTAPAYDYPTFGTEEDLLLTRLEYAARRRITPLMRAHVGPYLANRKEAVTLFLKWCRELGSAKLLDILSIGSSQLTQEKFGKEWGDSPNGGGVPINSVDEFQEIWKAARPMLVRTYAGTTDIPELAEMYEEALHMAWHTLSFWWFSQIDGRGPLSVRDNLTQHLRTLEVIARHGKPFEPNIPHHFAFRGADDVSYVVSGVLAARTAKRLGIKTLVLQVMLNTPKATWGVQDLAKARTLLLLCRELEDKNFRVLLQPRAGLDYFSPDLDKAKIQLAAVSALIDDIEPNNHSSPDIIHVVSYSEASHLADPQVVNDSVRITRGAIQRYRDLRAKGQVPEVSNSPEILSRTETLRRAARAVLASIENTIPNPYSVQGLYLAFKAGYLPVPYLWECKDEFRHAINWKTKILKGSVQLVDSTGHPMSVEERCSISERNFRILTS